MLKKMLIFLIVQNNWNVVLQNAQFYDLCKFSPILHNLLCHFYCFVEIILTLLCMGKGPRSDKSHWRPALKHWKSYFTISLALSFHIRASEGGDGSDVWHHRQSLTAPPFNESARLHKLWYQLPPVCTCWWRGHLIQSRKAFAPAVGRGQPMSKGLVPSGASQGRPHRSDEVPPGRWVVAQGVGKDLHIVTE